MANKIYTAILVSFLLIGLHGAPARAQNAAVPWRIICSDPASPTKAANPRSCRLEQVLRPTGKENKRGNLLSLIVFHSGKEIRTPRMIMRLPLGVDLRSGMVLKVDNSPEITARFVQCRNSGCEVHLELTSLLLGMMKRGNRITVGFRPFGSTKTLAVNASLKGFTKAFEQIR